MKLVAHLFQEEILKQHKSCSVPPPLQLQREGTPRPLKIQFLERGEEHDKKKQGMERGLDKCPCSCRRVEWEGVLWGVGGVSGLWPEERRGGVRHIKSGLRRQQVTSELKRLTELQ